MTNSRRVCVRKRSQASASHAAFVSYRAFVFVSCPCVVSSCRVFVVFVSCRVFIFVSGPCVVSWSRVVVSCLRVSYRVFVFVSCPLAVSLCRALVSCLRLRVLSFCPRRVFVSCRVLVSCFRVVSCLRVVSCHSFHQATLAICDADACDVRQCNCNPPPGKGLWGLRGLGFRGMRFSTLNLTLLAPYIRPRKTRKTPSLAASQQLLPQGFLEGRPKTLHTLRPQELRCRHPETH